MRCTEAIEKLPALLDGEADGESARALRGHLAACPACREKEERLRFLARALDTLEAPEPPAGMAAAIVAAVSREPSPAVRPSRWRAGLVAAAALVAGIAFGALLGNFAVSGTPEGAGAASPQASADDELALLLGDTPAGDGEWTLALLDDEEPEGEGR